MDPIPRDHIYKILEAGGQAPSGSNSQPWKFKVNGNTIEIIALPEKDHPILNFRYRGTWIAHGALIENLLIAASALGYKADLELIPLSPISQITARIKLSQGDVQKENLSLYQTISTRATNRKPYKTTPLTSEQKNLLLQEAERIRKGQFKLIEDKEKIQKLVTASCKDVTIMLEDRDLHELFFKEIVWTEKEEKEKKTGLYIKTMELQPPQENALKLFKNWGLMKFFNFLGMAKAIAKTNEKLYAKSAAVGAIIINDTDDEFLTAGRIMQRVWLKATEMGLSCHLMTGILFFWQRLKNDNDNKFSQKHRNLIQKSCEDISNVLEVNNSDKTIALLMRIGDGGRPSGLSSKMNPVIIT